MKWRLVEWKRVSQGEPSEDINHLSNLMDKINPRVKDEGLIYTLEKVE